MKTVRKHEKKTSKHFHSWNRFTTALALALLHSSVSAGNGPRLHSVHLLLSGIVSYEPGGKFTANKTYHMRWMGWHNSSTYHRLVCEERAVKLIRTVFHHREAEAGVIGLFPDAHRLLYVTVPYLHICPSADVVSKPKGRIFACANIFCRFVLFAVLLSGYYGTNVQQVVSSNKIADMLI